mgnify:CR=1 FL=1
MMSRLKTIDDKTKIFNETIPTPPIPGVRQDYSFGKLIKFVPFKMAYSLGVHNL